jgi:hypothetical protein
MKQRFLQERPGWKVELERRLREYRSNKRATKRKDLDSEKTAARAA